MTPSTISPSQVRHSHRVGFWVVAVAFTTVMAFTTVPTPLWSIYAQQDRISSLTVTIAFGVYALAVALSLFLVGHLSDSYGRRRVLMPALALEVLAALVFAGSSSLLALLTARVLSGLGVGAVTATAVAWISELGAGRPRAQLVATAANLGGLGLGSLISGALAQWTHPALLVPFAVFTGAMLLAWAALLLAPETRELPTPRPRYRPQRVAVPARSRRRFLAAAAGGAITFAVFGLLGSLAPSFVAGTLHQPSHLLAGAVPFAAFAMAALAQTLARSLTTHSLLAAAIMALLAGLGLLTLAVWLRSPSFGMFVAGDVVVGFGCGLMFKGAIATVTEISAPEHRAEALAGIYLASYLGLAGPVIGLGALTQIASAPVGLLIFAGLLVIGMLAATPALLGHDATRTPQIHQPSPETSASGQRNMPDGHSNHAADRARRNPTAGAPARLGTDPTRGREDRPIPRSRHHHVLHWPGVTSRPSPARRPVGHVIGHAIGEPLPPARGNRPAGHVVGRPNHGATRP